MDQENNQEVQKKIDTIDEEDSNDDNDEKGANNAPSDNKQKSKGRDENAKEKKEKKRDEDKEDNRPPTRKVTEAELEAIVERLFSTSTKSLSARPEQSARARDQITRAGISAEDIPEITSRLAKTHTKSSSGGAQCKPHPEMPPIGYGLKAYPVIEGIETRFKGSGGSPEKAAESSTRLMSAQTKASTSRLANPVILLYPERTTLMNEPERIRAFQTSGDTCRQAALGRREKWFN